MSDSKVWQAVISNETHITHRDLIDHFGSPYRIAVTTGRKRVTVTSSGKDGDIRTDNDNLLVEVYEAENGEVRVVEKGLNDGK